MTKTKLTPERQRMRRIVENFQHYVATYSKQEHFDSYSDTIFIDDMLYGIGIAIDKAHYEFADGFAKFKEVIRERLPDEPSASETPAPEPPYYVRTFWSPDKHYLVTVHVTVPPGGDCNIIGFQDDDGKEWEPASEQQDMTKPSKSTTLPPAPRCKAKDCQLFVESGGEYCPDHL